MSRREAVAGLAAAIGAARSWSQPPAAATLRATGAGDLRFGSAIRAASLDDPVLRALAVAQCATLTPELEFKWGALAAVPGAYDFAAGDRIAAFARANGLRLRGHTLLWHRSIPPWAAAELARGADWSILRDHIRAVVLRYGAAVDEWDVVNEPIEVGARPDGLRASPFLAAFGRDYIARALHETHAAAPAARLMINEYDIEYPLPAQQARRTALLALARSLVERGVPLHGIGIQAHLDIGKGPIDSGLLKAFVADVAALGLRVSVTELDVKERDYILPAAERDRLVAGHVAAFLAGVLPSPAVRSISCWGLSDRQSWLDVTPADRARFPGAWRDGSSPGVNRGLPFDAAGTPKPMHDVIAKALAAA